MPHHPREEETESNIYDKVAKQSDDSTASDHPIHKENEEPVKATAQDHVSKGPQLSDKMPSVEGTKDELKAKAQALNK